MTDPTFDYKLLTTAECDYEMPGQPYPLSCGEPAIAKVSWRYVDGYFETMLVCQEHFKIIQAGEGER